jgi:imidazolonepropionase-like amidohydrolase
LAVPAGTTVVDGTGRTLLPGLIDAHPHATGLSQLRQSLVFGVTTAWPGRLR